MLSPGATSGAETAKVVVKSNGNVGIGVAEPAAPLHVRSHMAVGPLSQGEAEGRLEVSGKTAEIAFMRRSLTAWAAKPLAGDRFLWYNPDGTARLWTEEKGDLLSVTAAGAVGIGTSDPQGKLNIVHKAEDANGSAVIVGPTNGANLRLGYHADYAWIQSHGSKPLMINPVGNAVTIRQEDWQPVKFQDGWTDYGAKYNPAAFFKDSLGIVHLRGLVKDGGLGYEKTIFTLPPGYRPEFRQLFVNARHDQASGRVDVETNGRVIPTSGTSNWMSLDGLTFRAV